jgi:hypothetical protein
MNQSPTQNGRHFVITGLTEYVVTMLNPNHKVVGGCDLNLMVKGSTEPTVDGDLVATVTETNKWGDPIEADTPAPGIPRRSPKETRALARSMHCAPGMSAESCEREAR